MNTPPTPEEVLGQHLDATQGGFEEDMLHNYRDDSFLIMQGGVYRGWTGFAIVIAR